MTEAVGIISKISGATDVVKNHSKIAFALIVVLLIIILVQYAHTHNFLTKIPGGATVSSIIFKKGSSGGAVKSGKNKKKDKKCSDDSCSADSDSDSESDDEVDKLIQETKN